MGGGGDARPRPTGLTVPFSSSENRENRALPPRLPASEGASPWSWGLLFPSKSQRGTVSLPLSHQSKHFVYEILPQISRMRKRASSTFILNLN